MCVPQTGWNYIGNSTCLKQDKLFTIYTNYYVFDINASDVLLI